MNNPGDSTADTVDLVDAEEGLSVTYRLRRCCCGNKKRLLIILLALVLVVGIGIALILTYIKPKTGDSSSGEPKTCETTMCYKISRDISSQLDKTVDPCEDFYAYSCGGFFKSHHLGDDQSKEDAFTILREDNLKVLRKALQNVTNYSQSLSIKKTAKIYSSCISTSAIDNRGIAPLEDLIERYGGWRVSGKGLNVWTVEEKMGRILRDLNVPTLLPVSVGTDLVDSDKHILEFSPSALGMSPSYYVLDTDESLKIRRAYKEYMNTIARLLGGGFDAEDKMTKIYNFEKKLVKAMVGLPYSDDLVESVQQYRRSGRSLESLDRTIYDFCWDSGFEESFILNYLNNTFSEQVITFSSNESVYYYRGNDGEATIFQGIHSAYLDTIDTWEEDVIKDYIMWHVVSKYVMSMPRQFVEAKLKFAEAVAGVRKFQRWSYCIEAMMTPMDMALGRLFVDVDFDETTENTVKDMTSRIRKSFIDNLKSQDWMDSETKAAAKEKANAMQEDVGYPPYIKKDSELDTHYSMLTVGDDYFENTLAMNKMLIQKQLGTLRHPVNKDKWLMGPAIINAYNSPQQNRIVILAGILRFPFYKKNYPKYLNYGSLAMVIAHEITHGFDNQGRLFDKNGNVKDWWSSSSELNFQDRAQCLVNQYSNYEVFEEHIDGKQTLNENIADNGGIKLAYEAYQSWVKENGKEQLLPDLDLSADQLFFIGFAMPWCSVYKKEAALYQLKNDVHSYHKYRVIGPLSNFERFAKAFSCSSGTKMNPQDKCAVW